MTLAGPLTNLSATAGLYSQLAAVLSGFAFTALLLYLSQTLGPERQTIDPAQQREGSRVDRQVSLVLLHTLGALVLSALLYGVLAGYPADSPNAFTGMLLNGPSFSVAVLGMFYATALVASRFEHLEPMVASARVLLGVFGPVGAMVLIAPAALDIRLSSCGIEPTAVAPQCSAASEFVITRPYGYGLGLTAIMLVITTASFIAGRTPTRPPADWVPRVVALGIIGAAAGTVGGNAFLATKPVSYTPPDSFLFAVLTAAFVLLTAFGVLSARSCHRIQPHPVRSAAVDVVTAAASTAGTTPSSSVASEDTSPCTAGDDPSPAVLTHRDPADANREGRVPPQFASDRDQRD